MKNIIFIIVIIISCHSCSQNNESEIEDNSIIGTWKLTSSYVNTMSGSSGEWKTIENGYSYTFNIDGSFESDRFDDCLQGNYELSDVKLTLNYSCSNFNSGFNENPIGTFIESYRIINNELVLSPEYILCENCAFKFEKIIK